MSSKVPDKGQQKNVLRPGPRSRRCRSCGASSRGSGLLSHVLDVRVARGSASRVHHAVHALLLAVAGSDELVAEVQGDDRGEGVLHEDAAVHLGALLPVAILVAGLVLAEVLDLVVAGLGAVLLVGEAALRGAIASAVEAASLVVGRAQVGLALLGVVREEAARCGVGAEAVDGGLLLGLVGVRRDVHAHRSAVVALAHDERGGGDLGVGDREVGLARLHVAPHEDALVLVGGAVPGRDVVLAGAAGLALEAVALDGLARAAVVERLADVHGVAVGLAASLAGREAALAGDDTVEVVRGGEAVVDVGEASLDVVLRDTLDLDLRARAVHDRDGAELGLGLLAGLVDAVVAHDVLARAAHVDDLIGDLNGVRDDAIDPVSAGGTSIGVLVLGGGIDDQVLVAHDLDGRGLGVDDVEGAEGGVAARDGAGRVRVVGAAVLVGRPQVLAVAALAVEATDAAVAHFVLAGELAELGEVTRAGGGRAALEGLVGGLGGAGLVAGNPAGAGREAGVRLARVAGGDTRVLGLDVRVDAVLELLDVLGGRLEEDGVEALDDNVRGVTVDNLDGAARVLGLGRGADTGVAGAVLDGVEDGLGGDLLEVHGEGVAGLDGVRGELLLVDDELAGLRGDLGGDVTVVGVEGTGAGVRVALVGLLAAASGALGAALTVLGVGTDDLELRGGVVRDGDGELVGGLVGRTVLTVVAGFVVHDGLDDVLDAVRAGRAELGADGAAHLRERELLVAGRRRLLAVHNREDVEADGAVDLLVDVVEGSVLRADGLRGDTGLGGGGAGVVAEDRRERLHG